MKNAIAVAYSGVHQAFQLALAAQELGQLDRFYCSFFAGKGKWGRMLERLLGAERLANREVDGLPAKAISENPWPLLAHYYRSRLRPETGNDWMQANSWFDRWVAKRLRESGCSIFVGVETCAAESFGVAREHDMVRVLDCPGIESTFLDRLATVAAEEFGLRTPGAADAPAMRERKRREIELADVIFVCSELQARLVALEAGRRRGVHVLPLWVDLSFWHPANDPIALRPGPLRVLFAGKLSLRKGVPYLIKAAISCDAPLRLTLVGMMDDALRPLLKPHRSWIRILPACTKAELRKHYREHDLLVLPSLGDAFGFVAMEAMACGLPVIVTENCGVPVPDPSWRVPVMDSEAIARRLALYAWDRSLCRVHGLAAAQFARQFTPAHYREKIKDIFRPLLEPCTAERPARTLDAALASDSSRLAI